MELRLTTADNISPENDGWRTGLFLNRLAAFLSITLIASGFFHLAFGYLANLEWDGAVSPRKPGLFGVSAGLTAWSLLWVAHKLGNPARLVILTSLIINALWWEVVFITIQYWRGVPSHFNRATEFDMAIEITMLILIFAATIGIAMLSWNAHASIAIDRGTLLVIRAGLDFLLLSCLLGFVAMIAGEINLANGRSPELLGAAGVLKYPHGIVLHAIQTLPILNAFLRWHRMKHRIGLLWIAIISHCFVLAHACWQTGNGRSRFEWDNFGGLLLAIAGLLFMIPVTGICLSLTARLLRNCRSASLHQTNPVGVVDHPISVR